MSLARPVVMPHAELKLDTPHSQLHIGCQAQLMCDQQKIRNVARDLQAMLRCENGPLLAPGFQRCQSKLKRCTLTDQVGAGMEDHSPAQAQTQARQAKSSQRLLSGLAPERL